MMANLGMGSILVNYYRKKDPKDEHPPKVSMFRVTFKPYS